MRREVVAGRDTILGDTLKKNAYTSTLSFDTPLTIFGYSLGNRFTINSARNDFPERAIVADVKTGVEQERIYATTYHTEVDWTPSFTLPSLGRNKFNLTPSVSLSNVDAGAFWIRNERTGGEWVHQSKRLTYGLSASPTLYGLFDRGGKGFGPFAKLRHSIQPTFGYAYAPAADVSDEYLAALGRTKVSSTGSSTGYLPSLAQNSMNVGLSTNLEAKLRSRNDSNPDAGDKIKLLSVNFTGLSYDFERARATGSKIRGLTTQNFGYTVRSDLLPGVDLGVDYSLFEGSTQSDTARFKPFRERVTAAVQFSDQNNPFAVFSRIFGKAVPPSAAGTDRTRPSPDDKYAREIASQPVAGRGARTAAYLPSISQGWQASFTFTSSRQRPPGGNPSNIVQFDPATRCVQFNTPALRVLYVWSRRLALLSDAAHDVARQQPEHEGDGEMGRGVADELRLRAAQFRQPDRIVAARPARLARHLRLHAVPERQLRVQLPHLAEGGARVEVRLPQGDLPERRAALISGRAMRHP
ncbi:MAG: hypothetical protein DMD35_15355 [Gemmatimonadetes bacterium]|nr:MAG: hypothetical protein DMD35_15355 [Gemmatimonadota bacterium]